MLQILHTVISEKSQANTHSIHENGMKNPQFAIDIEALRDYTYVLDDTIQK